ncbi:MAG: hypothetical protein WCV62_01125 [Candidatus Peribacteraceae bacterium]
MPKNQESRKGTRAAREHPAEGEPHDSHSLYDSGQFDDILQSELHRMGVGYGALGHGITSHHEAVANVRSQVQALRAQHQERGETVRQESSHIVTFIRIILSRLLSTSGFSRDHAKPASER